MLVLMLGNIEMPCNRLYLFSLNLILSQTCFHEVACKQWFTLPLVCGISEMFRAGRYRRYYKNNKTIFDRKKQIRGCLGNKLEKLT
ncbi:unknown [Prevotella sp. CAG:1058]|nr:unknown [Prevotella sp. CAG:1058]